MPKRPPGEADYEYRKPVKHMSLNEREGKVNLVHGLYEAGLMSERIYIRAVAHLSLTPFEEPMPVERAREMRRRSSGNKKKTA